MTDHPDNEPVTPHRRKSDLTLLGSSSQALDDKIYTLTFGVDLADISFEGLHNYSVSVGRRNKNGDGIENLSCVLKIGLQSKTYNVSIEGGPPYDFSITDKTLDLTSHELDASIVDAVKTGISWVKGDIKDNWVKQNRRQVPSALFSDDIAISLVMSSISTLVGGATECHREVVSDKQHMFLTKEDYINVMYDSLKDKMDSFTELAIHRCVNYYLGSS